MHGSAMFQLVKKLRNVKDGLKSLNRVEFSDLQVVESEAKARLELCQRLVHNNPSDKEVGEDEIKAGVDYRRIHSLYMSFLQQKAKISWIILGDDNIRLFHQAIRARKLQNNVYNNHDKEGILVENVQNVNAAFLEYYKSLLGSNRAQMGSI